MPDDIYSSMATEDPDRDDEIEEADIPNQISASQAESLSPNDSDVQTILKRLLPDITNLDLADINGYLHYMMVGRVFPDTYLSKKALTVLSIKRRHPKVGIMEIENIIDTVLSIGYNGKSRVEIVLVGNNAHEAEEEKESAI